MKLKLCVVTLAHEEIDNITIEQAPTTIGRDTDNTLVLADPRRYISGHHAAIYYRAPDYFITDTSTNGVLINDATLPVGDGNSIKLCDGDQLHIGDYTLVVNIVDKQQQIDIPNMSLADEVVNFSDDPFAELGSDSVQEMIDENQLMPEQEKESDPFKALNIPDFEGIPTGLIDEDKQSRPETAQPPPAFKEAFQPFKPEKKEQSSATANDLFADDWFKESQIGDSPSDEVFPEDFFSEPKTASNTPTEIKLEVQVPDKVVKSKNSDKSMGDSPPTNAPDFQSLIVDNFLRGAGLENAKINESLTPESFYIIGKILRASIQGTMDVLIGRAKIKNEMHLDVTTIKSIENNPVKFSVTAEEAIRKLLAPQDAGYLQAEEAIEEAFDDIRAHQFSVISGMQTALLEVLKRFDPQKLEQRLQQQSPLSASIPIHKQAKLWRLFEHLYDDIESEASDNFYHLFGQAFAESYEQQMIKLKDSKKDSPF